jgi:hypothetical protein
MAVADTTYQLLEEVSRLISTKEKEISLSLKKKTQRMAIDGSSKITSSSLNRPALQIRSKSSPPEAYSITIARCVGVSTTCNEIKMKGNKINQIDCRHVLLPINHTALKLKDPKWTPL